MILMNDIFVVTV